MSRTLLTCCASALLFCVLLVSTAARGSEPSSQPVARPSTPGVTAEFHIEREGGAPDPSGTLRRRNS